MERFVLVDGVPAADGRVVLDADDPTLVLGCGVFETLRTYGGRLFGLGEHLRRLSGSAQALGMDLPPVDLIGTELQEAADRIEGDAMVRITLTSNGVRIVRASALPLLPEVFRCATRRFVPPTWLDGEVKHTSRGFAVQAVRLAGVDEVIWTDADGLILEGTRSNVFAVKDGVLRTPALDGRLLAGVTRAAVIAIAVELGVSVDQGALAAGDDFDELYLSSTLKELTPIGELDGQQAAGLGPVGARVRNAFVAHALSSV